MKRSRRPFFTPKAFVAGLFLFLVAASGYSFVTAAPADKDKGKDKDKTPPVITELRADAVSESSATIAWTTDEPADSDIKYGIDPHTNINGPADTTLVISHAIVLSGLAPETTYAYCIRTRDAANNKAEACGTFITLAVPPPTPSGGGGSQPPQAKFVVSGYAYPRATIALSLQGIPFGDTYAKEIKATHDGAFAVEFTKFPKGLYAFTVLATDAGGATSARKGIQFELLKAGEQFSKDRVILPPTISVARDVVAWGDDLVVSGSAMPNTGVLIDVEGRVFETKSDANGSYELLINTAQFAGTKISVRARTAMVSKSGYDYSLSKIVTLSSSAMPTADLNADGAVDVTDFSIFLAKPIDVNGDAKTNATDVSIFLRAFAQ